MPVYLVHIAMGLFSWLGEGWVKYALLAAAGVLVYILARGVFAWVRAQLRGLRWWFLLRFARRPVAERVVDGDTLKLEDGRTIRIIGADTDEPFVGEKLMRDAFAQDLSPAVLIQRGREASAYVRGLVEGRRVRLEYDPANRKRRHLDVHDRTLAHVWIVEGVDRPERLLSEVLIREGLARPTTFEHKYREQLREAYSGQQA